MQGCLDPLCEGRMNLEVFFKNAEHLFRKKQKSLPPGIAEISLNPSPVQRLLHYLFGDGNMNNVAIK